MLKLIIIGMALFGTCCALTSYHHGELWHTGFNVAQHTIMWAWVILAAIAYGSFQLHQGK